MISCTIENGEVQSEKCFNRFESFLCKARSKNVLKLIPVLHLHSYLSMKRTDHFKLSFIGRSQSKDIAACLLCRFALTYMYKTILSHFIKSLRYVQKY